MIFRLLKLTDHLEKFIGVLFPIICVNRILKTTFDRSAAIQNWLMPMLIRRELERGEIYNIAVYI